MKIPLDALTKEEIADEVVRRDKEISRLRGELEEARRQGHILETECKRLDNEISAERTRADLNYRALELACKAMQYPFVSSNPDYFIKKAQEEKK